MTSSQTDDTFNVRKWLNTRGRGGNAVKLTKPKQLAIWTKRSVKADGGFAYNDRSGLLPFQAPPLPADLNAGYPDQFTRKTQGESSPVEPIIHACIDSSIDWNRCDVCTFRNNLNKICMTPLSLGEEWAVDACLWQGTMFLDIVKMPEKEFPDSDRFMYYGYKFEALCTDSTHVDATSEFAVVVQYRLGSVRVVMGCEIDCEDPALAGDNPLSGYLELKTYRLPRNRHQEGNVARNKYPRWWVQSFLAGVPTLVLGGRDDQGMLQEVRRLEVQRLPDMAASLGQSWDAFQLLAFGEAVLAWMKGRAQAHAGQQLRFLYQAARQEISCEVVPDGGMPARMAKARPPMASGQSGAAEHAA